MKSVNYQVVPYPKSRQPIVDYLTVARSKHTIHGILEFDVTAPRQVMREHKTRTGESPSFTAFIICCLAKAIDENKKLHAYRRGRNWLVIYDEVDISTPVEREVKGHRIGTPYVVRSANAKTFREIHQEIRTAQVEEAGAHTRMQRSGLLPNALTRLFWMLLAISPHLKKKYTGTVGITAVGMFGKGAGWGIPITDYTLQVTLGGIAEKPWAVDGRIEVRDILSLTLSFDHDVVDGAPAARFAQRFKELVESGYGLITDQGDG